MSTKNTPFISGKMPPKLNEKRLIQIRFMMEEVKVDGMAITYLPNIRYLTNFSGSSAFMFIFADSIHFVTDDRYEYGLEDELYELPNMYIHIARDPWTYGVKSKLFKGIQTLGFESDRLGYTEAVDIRNVIRPIKFKPTPCEIEPFTRPKDPMELDFIKQSCAMSEKVYEKMLTIIKPGMTEREIQIELLHQCRLAGSEGEPFEPMVLSGARTALVHANPSDKQVKKGELLLMDFGCRVNGFCSDITRVVSLGKPTKDQKAIYKIVYDAKQAAIANIRPGVNGQVLDKSARAVLDAAGYGEYFKHSLGHGIGIANHERPTINSRQDDQIVPEDAVISIEPGVYLKDKYGIRLEDNVHVTRNGAIHFTNAPDDLISI